MIIKRILTISAISIALAACGSSSDNNADGDQDGTTDGSTDGTTDGSTDGTTDGSTDGTTDGSTDGTTDGSTDGTTDGSTDGGGQLTGNVVNWGIVDLDEIDSEVEPSAGFGRFTADFAATALLENIIPSQDSCEVSRSDPFNPPTDIDFDFDFDVAFESLSAGEVITITSPAGTYSELMRVTFGNTTAYATQTELTGPAPSGLVVDIPGDEYPAFSNVPIPDTSALLLSSPADNAPVTPTTQFSWNADSSGDTAVDISVSAVDLTNGQTISVDCTVVDDGSFSFDSATQSEMGSDFTSLGLFASRVAYNFVQSGTTVLVVSHTIEN